MQFGFMIGTNEAIAGDIDSVICLEYTVIGDAVNLASGIYALSLKLKSGSLGKPMSRYREEFKFKVLETQYLKVKKKAVTVYHLAASITGTL